MKKRAKSVPMEAPHDGPIYSRIELPDGSAFWVVWANWDAMIDGETMSFGRASSVEEAEAECRKVAGLNSQQIQASFSENVHREQAQEKRAEESEIAGLTSGSSPAVGKNS
jgi:hypothetical protein